jgi:hypothetical protein
MRAVLQALAPGAAALAAARRDSPNGAARERAALECLRLLGAGFGVDVPLVQRLRSAELGAQEAGSSMTRVRPAISAEDVHC